MNALGPSNRHPLDCDCADCDEFEPWRRNPPPPVEPHAAKRAAYEAHRRAYREQYRALYDLPPIETLGRGPSVPGKGTP